MFYLLNVKNTEERAYNLLKITQEHLAGPAVKAWSLKFILSTTSLLPAAPRHLRKITWQSLWPVALRIPAMVTIVSESRLIPIL